MLQRQRHSSISAKAIRKTFQLSLLAMSGLVVSVPASAEVYKWVDAYGKVHYSDSPHGQDATFGGNRTVSTPKNKPIAIIEEPAVKRPVTKVEAPATEGVTASSPAVAPDVDPLLTAAIDQGDINRLSQLIIENKLEFRSYQMQGSGESLLIHAVRRHQLQSADFLLKMRVDVNLVDADGHSAVYYAVKDFPQDEHLRDMLVQYGASLQGLQASAAPSQTATAPQ